MNILNYIQCFENILDPVICDEIIKNSKNEIFSSSKTSEDVNVNNYRKCYDKPLNKKYEEYLFKIVGNVLIKYKEKVPYFSTGLSTEDTGYNHLLYKGSEGGKYKTHIDSFEKEPRLISISILLNDDFDGGNFCFYDEHIIEKKIGSAVVFPSNFCFPHGVLPVSNGDRHAVITWMR